MVIRDTVDDCTGSGDTGTACDQEHYCWLYWPGNAETYMAALRNTVAGLKVVWWQWDSCGGDQKHCCWLAWCGSDQEHSCQNTLVFWYWDWCGGDKEHCFWLTLVWWLCTSVAANINPVAGLTLGLVWPRSGTLFLVYTGNQEHCCWLTQYSDAALGWLVIRSTGWLLCWHCTVDTADHRACYCMY